MRSRPSEIRSRRLKQYRMDTPLTPRRGEGQGILIARIMIIMKLHLLPAFVRGDFFRVVVESPRGSNAKLKFDPELEAMSLSRPLTYGLTYPFDWGFVPGTRASDGDPLDAMLMWDTATFPGVVIPCRALGI